MEFRVLGPLSVQEAGQDLIRATGKPRQLLALLLLNEPNRVATSALVTELWDDTPPCRPTTTLQTHISHLRTEFARRFGVPRQVIARDVLQTCDSGYRIDVGGASFDLAEFNRLRPLTRALLNAGDTLGAGRMLAEALSLWRGPALLDVDQGRLLRAAVAGLDECRLDALALFFGTQVELGRCREIRCELARLVVLHPHHEELHAQFMIALARSGCRARALAVFEELGRRLHDDLGAAPSGRVTQLCHDIRTGDPVTLGAIGPPAGHATRVPKGHVTDPAAAAHRAAAASPSGS